MRRKTLLVMGIIAVLFLAFWGLLLHYETHMTIPQGMSGTADYLMTEMGLQFSSMLLALLTIMLAAGTIASDLDTGLVHGILSRPISRLQYVLGKLGGLAVMTIAASTVFYVLFLAIGAVFGLSTITALTLWQLIGGWLLFLTAPLAVLCLTLWGSVRFKTVPNGILMIFIYILGNIGGMVEMVGQLLNSRTINSAGIVISLISPFHVLYVICQNVLLPSANILQNAAQLAGGLTGGGAAPSPWMYLYIALYALAFIALAVHGFAKKDIA